MILQNVSDFEFTTTVSTDGARKGLKNVENADSALGQPVEDTGRRLMC